MYPDLYKKYSGLLIIKKKPLLKVALIMKKIYAKETKKALITQNHNQYW